MPCLVRSEMDGRCSTWELLFSHTVSFSLHSHPSSLPWCLPLPAASSGPANQSHGHWSLFPTTQKKNASSSRRGFFFLREKKGLQINLLVTVTFYYLNSAPLISMHRGVSSQQGMLWYSEVISRLTVLQGFLINTLSMPSRLPHWLYRIKVFPIESKRSSCTYNSLQSAPVVQLHVHRYRKCKLGKAALCWKSFDKCAMCNVQCITCYILFFFYSHALPGMAILVSQSADASLLSSLKCLNNF